MTQQELRAIIYNGIITNYHNVNRFSKATGVERARLIRFLQGKKTITLETAIEYTRHLNLEVKIE